MGDAMRLLPFDELLTRIFEEYRDGGSIFDLPEDSWFRKKNGKSLSIFGNPMETPLGPAAGPHTQLASNIIASYLTGSRFIELKTVQILDSLEIEKPCIDAADEGYNTEWSTELSLDEAWQEYAKAWIILHLLEELFGLRRTENRRSFVFNMSVGYDLKGIKSEPMQRYLRRMKDSSSEKLFSGWIDQAKQMLPELLKGSELERRSRVLSDFRVSGKICGSVTLSTMHGCPPEEIEAICSYMLREQKLDTYVKLNPTLLGYGTVREILDGLGYTYVELNPESFEHDLQLPRALEILSRLRKLAADSGRNFGVKLTNTLACRNNQGRLPGEEMYLSGRALFPLSINVAARLSEEFGGELPISFSGGISIHNAAEVFATGIRPVTLATELLKPGGYLRQVQLAKLLEELPEADWQRERIDVQALKSLAASSLRDRSLSKEFRGSDAVHNPGELPLFDCYVAPCVSACAIGQHIPEYLRLAGEGRYGEALECIYERNALPSITGHICDHQCQLVCTRLDYEGALNIREVKKISLLKGMEEYQRRWVKPEIRHPERIAVVGAGPAGLSAAYFLAREGFSVTVLEREEDAGGVVRYVVPHFRISREAIDRDIDFIRQHGVEFRFGVDENIDIEALKKEGFTYIVLGLGTYRSRKLPIEGDSQRIYPSLSFLTQFNRDPSRLKVGRRVVVIGAGDTAMDCARAALRCSGVEEVQIAYRRAFEQMPASREEYEYAAEDGISFRWLRNPERFSADGSLTLRVMELGEPDESGRRRPVPTDRTEEIKADSLIYAVGDDPDSDALKSAGLEPDVKGMVPTGEGGETDRENIFLIGDSRTGASTIVNCIAEGRRAADAICRKSDSLWERSELIPYLDPEERTADIAVKKGHLSSRPDPRSDYDSASFCATEKSRCLECDFLCNKCVDVCPNRANIKVETAGQEQFDDAFQIVHIDAYCNECGNCGQFCPWDGRPYADKPTVFSSPADFENSSNPGWLLENGSLRVRFQGRVQTLDLGEAFKRSEGRDDEARFYRLFELLHHRRPHLFTRLSSGGAV
ncbi:putative selenate reductase subunit YgfK [Marispirochaeta aestuarii]|uniref:Putative selenate reductase subunit YgfK n=1 Tax=Marispirochaeta aestuarii TaxID=1963862 RepID=A0A1Y1RWJ2_9SPIO|nr:putative selenate reductase subunit YgfK [Marispirochaeta aestuarii]ORC34006.1 putative selenate reductase subunit YgfK [Marispirochaeta aestuarii]